MHPLPEGERWGYPSDEAAYPLAAFLFDGDSDGEPFTLGFEDRGEARGLHRYYDRQVRREATRERISLALRIDPDEFAALLAPGSGAPDIRSVFRIDTGRGIVRATLRSIGEYDPEARLGPLHVRPARRRLSRRSTRNHSTRKKMTRIEERMIRAAADRVPRNDGRRGPSRCSSAKGC